MSSSKPICVGRVNRWTRNSAQRIANHYYESLAFSQHNIDLVFDEETMEPERLTEAPENASIDPSTMRVSKWYQEPTREDDDSHFSSSSRVSDVFTGTSRTSYQEREPIENDAERLAMKRGGMPPPSPQRVANPRIRDVQALHEFYSNSDKMRRATSDDGFTQAWFDYSRFDLSSRNLWEKKVQTLNSLTCHRTSVAFSLTTWVLLTRGVNSGDQRTWTSLLPKVKSSMSPICHFSENYGETTTRLWFWQQRLTAHQQMKRSSLRTMAWWDATLAEAMICHSTQEFDSTGYVGLFSESSEEDDKKYTCSDLWSEW